MKNINDIINEDSGYWLQALRKAGAGQYVIKSLQRGDDNNTIADNEPITKAHLARILSEVYIDLKRK